ncbi:uncharacterized protein LOC128875008 [Hylaeus volcanicus]|uniref:uncharacterized protein LOC128875008 n=1 Tax=Hylaeus volcanicus TaxID=313075 RepID=UPI0023B798E8|nr:uncharacterized protein LOC128875008 [Hylaeus volcanicus]
MRSRVNLVAILLTLSCVARVLESARSDDKGHKGYSVGKKVFKEAHSKIAPQSAIFLRGEDKTKLVKTQTRHNVLPLSKDYLGGPDRPRRRKRKMDRTMMALLMAYKMKFFALIPTMLGGLILLKATALLAGFFFALFAAVLGLKVR